MNTNLLLNFFNSYTTYYLLGIIVLPALILAAIAQAKVSSAFNTFSKMMSSGGKSASQIAREMLDNAGLQHVKVVKIRGSLTDNYNPKTKTVSLSSSVCDSSSVAAIGVAAHEVGHAIQYKNKYIPVILRNTLVPITNFASTALWPLVIIGLMFNFGAEVQNPVGNIFIFAGIVVFGLSALFNLVTLPVEFNASSRALKTLTTTQTLTAKEIQGAKKVLNAAALTYVAAMLVSVLNLLRFVLSVRGRD